MVAMFMKPELLIAESTATWQCDGLSWTAEARAVLDGAAPAAFDSGWACVRALGLVIAAKVPYEIICKLDDRQTRERVIDRTIGVEILLPDLVMVETNDQNKRVRVESAHIYGRLVAPASDPLMYTFEPTAGASTWVRKRAHGRPR